MLIMNQIRISRLVRMDRLDRKWNDAPGTTLRVVLNAQLVVAEVWRTNVKERAARRPPLTTTKLRERVMGETTAVAGRRKATAMEISGRGVATSATETQLSTTVVELQVLQSRAGTPKPRCKL
jgi:hypothetical protein